MKTKYEIQAENFLRFTKTKLTIKFKKQGFYFNGDKERRNIYTFTLKNANGQYTSTFGDSIYNTEKGIKPTAYSILACLEKYEHGTFEEFCNDFRYNDLPLSEYPKIKKIYENCKKQYLALCRLFTKEQLNELAEIQ